MALHISRYSKRHYACDLREHRLYQTNVASGIEAHVIDLQFTLTTKTVLGDKHKVSMYNTRITDA